MSDVDARHVMCPCCTQPMQTMRLSAIEIDRCERCGGLWFDCGELKQLRAHGDDTDLRVELERVVAAPLDAPQRADVSIACPLCAIKMVRRPHEDAPGVVIDRCQQHGTWLDRGEALRLLALAKQTEEARARAWSEQHKPKRRGWLSAVLDLFD